MSDAGQQVKFLKEMDYCFNNFATGLQQLIPDLTIEETAYCCLFHLNIRTSDIAEMFSRSKSTIQAGGNALKPKSMLKISLQTEASNRNRTNSHVMILQVVEYQNHNT